MPMRTPIMRSTVAPTGTLLSKNNLQRSSMTQHAPIRRSDSSRIETWRDEVNMCIPPSTNSQNIAPLTSSSNANNQPTSSPNNQEHKEGTLSRVTSKVFKRRSTTATAAGTESLHSGREGDVARTSMYDGDRPGERFMDSWEEGGGESMYFGSMGESEGGRLNRAEQLLKFGCREGGKNVAEEVKGVQQAAV